MFSASLLSLALLAQSVFASWGGASLRVPAGTMKTVSGSFVVPQVSAPDNWVAGYEYRASTWVGIDGFSLTPNGPSCPNMLQSGIATRVTLDANGVPTYLCCPWYEWLPAGVVTFDPSCQWCKAGDAINVTVVATSTTAGSATIVNQSTGKIYTTSVSSPSAPLCLEFADWVVEQGGTGGHIAAFDAITIKPSATLVSGATAVPTGTGVYTHNIVVSSTTYATGFATSTAVVVTDEPWYAA